MQFPMTKREYARLRGWSTERVERALLTGRLVGHRDPGSGWWMIDRETNVDGNVLQNAAPAELDLGAVIGR